MDMTPEQLRAVEGTVRRAVSEAIQEHEESRHLPFEVEDFLRNNQLAIEWLVDTVRGPKVVDPITGVVQDQRDTTQGLDERVRRIEEQTSLLPKLAETVERMEKSLNGKQSLGVKELSKIGATVGVVLAAVLEGMRAVFRV